MMRRVGECNKCGQCCGADGSPAQTSPFPNGWPETVRNWQLDDFKKSWPLVKLFPFEDKPDGTIGPVRRSGSHKIKGREYAFAWVPGQGICKSPESPECPFLMPPTAEMAVGDTPVRLCALVGTRHESVRNLACAPAPPLLLSEGSVKQFLEDHPACSYTWEPE